MSEKVKARCGLGLLIFLSLIVATAACVWLHDRFDFTEYFTFYRQPFSLVDVNEETGEVKPHVGAYSVKGKIWYSLDRYCPQDVTVDVSRRIMRWTQDSTGGWHKHPAYTFKPTYNINVEHGRVENDQPVDLTEAAPFLVLGEGYYIETYIHVHTRDLLGKDYTTRTDTFAIK